MANSRSSGTATARSPCGAARISALRRVRARSLAYTASILTEPSRRATSRDLPLAQRRERHVEVADEPSRLGAHHAAVADQVDGGRHVRSRPIGPSEAPASRTPSSPNSTPEPSTSPVSPPRRRTRNADQRATTRSDPSRDHGTPSTQEPYARTRRRRRGAPAPPKATRTRGTPHPRHGRDSRRSIGDRSAAARAARQPAQGAGYVRAAPAGISARSRRERSGSRRSVRSRRTRRCDCPA